METGRKDVWLWGQAKTATSFSFSNCKLSIYSSLSLCSSLSFCLFFFSMLFFICLWLFSFFLFVSLELLSFLSYMQWQRQDEETTDERNENCSLLFLKTKNGQRKEPKRPAPDLQSPYSSFDQQGENYSPSKDKDIEAKMGGREKLSKQTNSNKTAQEARCSLHQQRHLIHSTLWLLTFPPIFNKQCLVWLSVNCLLASCFRHDFFFLFPSIGSKMRSNLAGLLRDAPGLLGKQRDK